MKIKRTPYPFLILTFIFSLLTVASAQPLTVKEIMKDPSIAGMRVSGERLSPDGKWVVYLWNAKGKNPRDLYLVSTSGGTPKKILSPNDLLTKKDDKKKVAPLEYGVVVNDEFVKSRRNGIGNLRWSPDSSKILFTQNGDIFVLKMGEAKPKKITKTQSFEFSASFLDNDRILFQQSGNFFSINTKDGTLTQISKEANRAKRISVFSATPSKNGEMIAYTASDTSKSRPLFVPNYLPYYTAAPTVRRGWSKQKVYATMTDGRLDKALEIKLPKQEGEAYISGLEWLADNKTLIVDRIDKTHKRRQIFLIEVRDDKTSFVYLAHEETDAKWVGRISRIIEAHPTDPGVFFFSSERKTGYNHLYLASLENELAPETDIGNEIDKLHIAPLSKKQLTRGKWEVGWAKWADDKKIIFSSTKESTSERGIYKTFTYSDIIHREDAISLKGMKTNVQISDLQNPSPNGSSVRTYIYSFSKWNQPPEIYAESICVRRTKCEKSQPRKLSNTTPRTFLKRKWNAPKFTEFSARDGKKVPAKIYFPTNFDKSKKSPMVIFVHGAGYLQNVINGWNNYYREFMFNQLLTQKGYVVLDIDYRGSAGYGRDWRTDVYDFLGGKDYTDHVDGIDFMVKEYNVDVNRIGVYGGSYGGFMAAMLVMRAPDKVAAAAALRPVMDWKNYYAANPFYTSQRLGDPKKNPEAYKRSSPIAYASQLRKKLLILHGLVDANVHAQDSIQLVEQLMRLDKTEHFDLMLYPAERHSFQRSTSWEDEYERILTLFEKELK